MSYKALKLNLSEKQVLDALKGKRIRVLPSQINTGTTFISLHPENAKKVEKAFLTKKGFLMTLSKGELAETAQRMDGSGFWGNVWSFLKKNWGVIKPVVSTVVDAAVAPLSAYTGQPALVGTARKLLKDTTGVGVKMSKKDKYDQMVAAGIYLS